MVECVVKGAPPCRAAPFVGLSWVPLLSATRLSPFVRAVRSSPPFRHRGRTLFATAYADHAKHHSEDCAKRDDCLRIHRRHLLQRLPGVAKHLRQFQQNTLPKRGVLFCCGHTPKRATMPCTRSIVPRRADRLRHDPVRLDAFPAFRYTAILRPGGGTADASVSKTDIERCVGSNPTPGTILSWKSPNNRTERTRSPSHGGVRAWNECFT